MLATCGSTPLTLADQEAPMKSLLSALLALFTSCAAFAAQPIPAAAAPANNSDQAEAVAGGNAFAADLYSQLRSHPGNLFFSPESIPQG